MSMLTHMYLLETYGPRMTLDEVGKVLKRKRQTIYNQISAGTFEIKTYKVRGERFCDAEEVAKHLDQARQEEAA